MFDNGGNLLLLEAKLRAYILPRLKESLRNRPIKPSDVQTLITIHDHPGCSIKDICFEINSDKGRQTKIVQDLMGAGLIENRSFNMRNYSLHLTEAGVDEYEFVRKELKRINDSLVVNFTERQKKDFVKLLDKIEEIADLGYEY